MLNMWYDFKIIQLEQGFDNNIRISRELDIYIEYKCIILHCPAILYDVFHWTDFIMSITDAQVGTVAHGPFVVYYSIKHYTCT